MTVKVDINTQALTRVLFVVSGFVLALGAIYIAREAIVLILAAMFLTVAINPPVSWLSKKLPGHSRGLATAISYTVVIVILFTLILSFVPPLVRQTETLIDNVPQFIDDAKNGTDFVSRIVEKYDLNDELDELQNATKKQVSNAGGPVVGFFQTLFSSTVSVLTVLVLTFFMLIEGPNWLKRFWEIQPRNKRHHRKQLAEKMYRVITGYVNGQLFVAGIAALFTFIMLVILRVDFAAPLAFLVGIFGLIPFIGATIGAVIIVTAAALNGVVPAVVMLVYYLIYQQIENNVIQPIIQSKTVDMSPLLVLVAAVVGVFVGGVLGAIVAIPVAASIRIVLNDYLERNVLGSK